MSPARLIPALLLAVSAAAAPPPYAKPPDWRRRVKLPCYPRELGFRVKAGDTDAVAAELRGWAGENHGVEVTPEGSSPMAWTFPASELAGFIRFMEGQGTVRRLAAHEPRYGTQGMLLSDRERVDLDKMPMIDARMVGAQREGLRRELDELSGRQGEMPSIFRLVEGYAAALDDVAESLKKFRSDVTAVVTVEPLQSTFIPVPSPEYLFYGAPILPASCTGFRWDRPHLPTGGNPSGDYLLWYQPPEPTLEQSRMLRAAAVVDDLDRGEEALERVLRAQGAVRAALKPRSPRTLANDQGGGTYAMAASGFWVPREHLDAVRSELAKLGRPRAWEWSRGGRPSYSAIADWASSLADELKGQSDRLSPFPYAQSLVLAEIESLRPYRELASLPANDELIEFDLLTPAKKGDAPSGSAPSDGGAVRPEVALPGRPGVGVAPPVVPSGSPSE